MTATPTAFLSRACAGLLALFVLLGTGCVTAAQGDAATRKVADGAIFAMQPGERVVLPDQSLLLYVKLAADSRCPPDVQCVWAGDAEVEFSRTLTGGSAQAFSLHTGRGATDSVFDGRRLVLVSLARGAAPRAELRVERAP